MSVFKPFYKLHLKQHTQNTPHNPLFIHILPLKPRTKERNEYKTPKQKKIMTKSKLAILLIIGLFVAAAIGLLLYLNMNSMVGPMSTPSNQTNNMHSTTSTNSVVGSTKIPAEIERLRALPNIKYQFDNLKVTDLATLDALTLEDETAHEFIEEAKWLIAQNELEHVTHSLSYLNEYVKTGVHEVCIPHELSHVYLMLEHNDKERAKNAIPEIQEHQSEWLTQAETKFKPFPPYYKIYQSIKEDIIQVIPRLANNQFDEVTMQLLKHISGNVVC